MRGVDPIVEKKLVQIAEGYVVEEDMLGVIAEIQRLWPTLSVQYCDPALAEAFDAPWRIVENCPDGLQRPVMEVWELDNRVLERIAAVDTQKVDLLASLDNINNDIRQAHKRRFREEIAAVSEMVAGVLRSHKDTYKATNPVTGAKHEFRSIKKSED